MDTTTHTTSTTHTTHEHGAHDMDTNTTSTTSTAPAPFHRAAGQSGRVRAVVIDGLRLAADVHTEPDGTTVAHIGPADGWRVSIAWGPRHYATAPARPTCSGCHRPHDVPEYAAGAVLAETAVLDPAGRLARITRHDTTRGYVTAPDALRLVALVGTFGPLSAPVGASVWRVVDAAGAFAD
jgi:hypothetical protein